MRHMMLWIHCTWHWNMQKQSILEAIHWRSSATQGCRRDILQRKTGYVVGANHNTSQTGPNRLNPVMLDPIGVCTSRHKCWWDNEGWQVWLVFEDQWQEMFIGQLCWDVQFHWEYEIAKPDDNIWKSWRSRKIMRLEPYVGSDCEFNQWKWCLTIFKCTRRRKNFNSWLSFSCVLNKNKRWNKKELKKKIE